MKKLTKLTALALALALLLGMTAFAGTPSKVVMTDEFTTTDMATFKAQEGRRPMGHGTANWAKNLYIIINGNGYGYDTLVKGGKYYGNSQGNFYNAGFYAANDGTIELRNTPGASMTFATNTITNQSQDAMSRQLAYIFPEEFAFNTEKALVAQIDWRPYNADNATTAAYALHAPSNIYPPIGVFMDYYDAINPTPTRKTKAMAVEGIVARAGQNKISMQGGKQDTVQRQPSDYVTIPFGTKSTMVTLFRPYNVMDEDNVANAIKGKEASGQVNSLDIVKLPDRRFTIAESSYHQAATSGAIHAVHGIFYNIPPKFDIGLSNFKLYEVSLDPADFTIENSEIENVGTDDAVEIIFSQPISANMGYSSFGNEADVLPLIKILDEEGNAVPSANYSMKISERIVDDAVKGVLTITPNEDWDFDSTYTVTFPYGFKNIARISMLDITGDEDQLAATATFATEAPASYTMTLNAYKGLAAAGDTLDALEEGTTYISVNATQTTGSPVANGNVRIEIIKEGAVVKYVTAKKAFVSNAATFGAAFKLEAGMSARAFVVGSEATATTIAAAN